MLKDIKTQELKLKKTARPKDRRTLGKTNPREGIKVSERKEKKYWKNRKDKTQHARIEKRPDKGRKDEKTDGAKKNE